MRSVTDSVTSDSPHSPLNKGDGRNVSAEPVEKSVDPRLPYKRTSTSIQTKKDDKAPSTIEMRGESIAADNQPNQDTDLDENALIKYLNLLAYRSTRQTEIDLASKQIAEKRQTAQDLVKKYPELQEVHLQMDGVVALLEDELKVLVKLQEQNKAESASVLSSMSSELKNLLKGIVPIPSKGTTSNQTPKSQLELETWSKRVEILETKDRLRNKEMLESEKKLLARIRQLEERDRVREESNKVLEGKLLGRLESLEKLSGSIQASQQPDFGREIAELKALHDDHKSKLARLSTQFTPANEFREHLEEYARFKKSPSFQVDATLRTKVDVTATKLTSLDTTVMQSSLDISQLTKNVEDVKTDFAKLKQLGEKYQAFWNTSSERLDNLEGRTASLKGLSEGQKAMSSKLEDHILTANQKQNLLEQKVNESITLRNDMAHQKQIDSLQSDIARFTQTMEQKYRAFSEKAQKELQAAASPSLSGLRTSGAISNDTALSEVKAEISKIRETTAKAEHGIRSLSHRYNQISTKALYDQISLSVAPHLSRIPDLEKANGGITERVADIEQSASGIATEIKEIKEQLSASSKSIRNESEALSKIATLEFKLAELTRNLDTSQSGENIGVVETRLANIEATQTQLPQLYYAKVNGDELDERLHGLEKVEIKSELDSLSARYNNVKMMCDQQQRIVDKYEEDIAAIDDKCNENTKTIEEHKGFSKQYKQTCDERQQELDSKEGELENLAGKITAVKANIDKLAERVERKDEEDKADIRTLKEHINSVKANEIAFIDVANLASRVKTADKVREILHPFRIHRAWFDGQRQENATTTFHAILAVNMIDVEEILRKHNGQKWIGRSVHIRLIPDDVTIDQIFTSVRPVSPTTENMKREATVVSSRQQSPSVIRSMPGHSVARNENATHLSRVPKASQTRIEGSEVMTPTFKGQVQRTPYISGSSRAGPSGTRESPHVIPDSQDPGIDINDADDTIEVNTSPMRSILDPENLESWTRRQPSSVGQKVRRDLDSPRSRSATTTPTNLKRAGSAGNGGTAKKPRQS